MADQQSLATALLAANPAYANQQVGFQAQQAIAQQLMQGGQQQGPLVVGGQLLPSSPNLALAHTLSSIAGTGLNAYAVTGQQKALADVLQGNPAQQQNLPAGVNGSFGNIPWLRGDPNGSVTALAIQGGDYAKTKAAETAPTDATKNAYQAFPSNPGAAQAVLQGTQLKDGTQSFRQGETVAVPGQPIQYTPKIPDNSTPVYGNPQAPIQATGITPLPGAQAAIAGQAGADAAATAPIDVKKAVDIQAGTNQVNSTKPLTPAETDKAVADAQNNLMAGEKSPYKIYQLAKASLETLRQGVSDQSSVSDSAIKTDLQQLLNPGVPVGVGSEEILMKDLQGFPDNLKGEIIRSISNGAKLSPAARQAALEIGQQRMTAYYGSAQTQFNTQKQALENQYPGQGQKLVWGGDDSYTAFKAAQAAIAARQKAR